MKSLWSDKAYRSNQLKIKSSQDYKENQATLSKARWSTQSYRQKLETGLNKTNYISKSINQYGDTFDYSVTNFSGWHDRIEIICKNCNNLLNKDPQKHLEHGFCQYCGTTKGQKQIHDYIVSLGCHPVLNNRTAINGLELDLYLPTLQLGIEYHGIYWHSYNTQETKAERERHQHKAIICTKAGIHLLQFFDFEWENKRDIIQSMIANAMQKSTKYNARDLKIVELNNKESKDFFESNHLLGHRTAKITYGLSSISGVHCALSFSKISGGYEIIRMASRIGETVRGGASRILNHFQKSHKRTLHTYADLRYSTGNAYNKLGFTKIKITPPGYFYSKQSHNGYRILSRQQCQKNKLYKLFQVDSTLSESQNMFMNGYRRVWTAGNILYSKTL